MTTKEAKDLKEQEVEEALERENREREPRYPFRQRTPTQIAQLQSSLEKAKEHPVTGFDMASRMKPEGMIQSHNQIEPCWCGDTHG